MDFKFNFGLDDEEPVAGELGREEAGAVDATDAPGFDPAREITVLGKEEELDGEAIEALFEDVPIQGRTPIRRCRPPNDETLPEALRAALGSSDLVPGVYEGGFKVWEGSIDLVELLVREKVELKGKTVIELGCGHAFPGIHALQEGASVDFQDYNAEVLEEVTVPNVIVNGGEAAAQRPPRYFAGDWGSLPAIAGEKKYDLVLTAETIYEEKASHRLLLCIDKLLAPSGVAYVAAKSYYFGVGGSTRGFEESVARLTPHRSVSRATLIQDGSSNVREVLRIS